MCVCVGGRGEGARAASRAMVWMGEEQGNSGISEGFVGGGWAWKECPMGSRYQMEVGDPREGRKLRRVTWTRWK